MPDFSDEHDGFFGSQRPNILGCDRMVICDNGSVGDVIVELFVNVW